MIRNMEEFCRFFKVRVPVNEHAAYYVQQLLRSAEHEALLTQVPVFERLEAREPALKAFWCRKVEEVRRRLKETAAYRLLLEEDFSEAPLPEIRFVPEPGKVYHLIDMRMANWTALRIYDLARELPNTWADLVEDEALALSKPFRQVVFGEVAPKRLQRVQARVMSELEERLVAGQFARPVVGRLPDELVVEHDYDWLAQCVSEVERFFPVSFSVTRFKQDRISKDRYLRTVYNGETDVVHHRRLMGVPGNMYFAYYRRQVLGEEEFDERDLLFTNEGVVAQWKGLNIPRRAS